MGRARFTKGNTTFGFNIFNIQDYREERKFLKFEDWFEVFWEEINTHPLSKESLKQFKKTILTRTMMVGLRKDLKPECIEHRFLCLHSLLFLAKFTLNQ